MKQGDSAKGDHKSPAYPMWMPRARRAPSTIGYGTYEQTLDTLEAALKPGPYLLGESFSAADVYLASQLGWALMMSSIEPREAFAAYVGRCVARPAFQRANAQVASGASA